MSTLEFIENLIREFQHCQTWEIVGITASPDEESKEEETQYFGKAYTIEKASGVPGMEDCCSGSVYIPLDNKFIKIIYSM